MKGKRIIALFLALAMVCLLAACGTGEEKAENKGPSTDENGTGIDPAEIALKVNDKEIPWGQISYWVYFQMSQYYASAGTMPNLSAEIGNSGTYGEMMLASAIKTATRYAAIDIYAEENGIALLDVDKIGVDNYIKNLEEQYGGAEAYDEALKTMGCTREDFYEIQRQTFLSQRVYKTVYGAGGTNITEDALADFSKQNGFVQAKAIIIMKADEDGNLLDDAAMKAADTKIDEVNAKLTAWSKADNQGYDTLEAYFDALMEEYNEDDTADYFPDGYLFKEGEMIDGAYQEVLATEEGSLTEVLKMEKADMVLLRLPIDYEDTPFSYLSKVQEGGSFSLRQYAATVMFDESVDSWAESVTAETMPIVAGIDPAEYFNQ